MSELEAGQQPAASAEIGQSVVPRHSAGDSPRFGRLLVVLILTVLLIVAITFGSEALYS